MKNHSFSTELSKLSTVPQAEERYKISRKTLMKHASEIGAVVRFGKSVRINIDKMDAYVDAQLNSDEKGATE